MVTKTSPVASKTELSKPFKKGSLSNHYLITAKASCADVSAHTSAIVNKAFFLEVNTPAPFGAAMGMAELKTHPRSTVANHTISRHS